jgi:hypothetical protein
MEKPLNAITTLTDGWVRLVSAAPSSKEMVQFSEWYSKPANSSTVMDIISIVIEMKIPAIMLISMGRLNYILHPRESLTDAWVPTESDIQAKCLETSRSIAASVEMTIGAQLSNKDMYTLDGCNSWIARTTMPLSSFVTATVYGTIGMWAEFCTAAGTHPAVKAYQNTISSIISAEYHQWNQITGRR